MDSNRVPTSSESDTVNALVDPPGSGPSAPPNRQSSQNEKSTTPAVKLLEASRNGYEDVVEGLLRRASNRAILKFDATEALPEASRAGHERVVEMLLNVHADVNAPPAKCGRNLEDKITVMNERDDCGQVSECGRIACGRTALQAAAEGGHAGLLSLLIEEGANINAPAQGQYGRTALQAASASRQVEIVSILLGAGANVNGNLAIYNGRTALQAAAENGHTEMVSMLLKAGAKVNAHPSILRGRTALQAAAEGGHAKVVSMLLDAKADVNALPARNSFGRTALQAAAGAGHIEIVSILLKAGAKVNAPAVGHGGRTALQAAAEGGHEKVVSMLLKAGADINGPPSRSYGRTALQAAAANGHIEMISVLLKAGARINAFPADNHGRTVLQAAAENGHTNIVLMLLSPDTQSVSDRLRVGVRGVGAIEPILSNLGVNINAAPSGYSGMTALQAAARNGHDEIASILLKTGADVNAAPSENYGRTALQAAAENGHAKTVSILLKAGAEVNAPPGKFHGQTALGAAVGSGHTVIVNMLLSHIQASDASMRVLSYGKKPLWIAAAQGHREVVKVLLQNGFDCNQEMFGKTAIRVAAEGGHGDVVEMLLHAGVDINAKDSNGSTCLHADLRHHGSIQVLLKNGVDIHSQDFDGDTPLHCAVRFQNVESLVALLDAGADTESKNYENQTPLDIVLHNLEIPSIKLVKALLDSGCSIKSRGVMNWRRLLDVTNHSILISEKQVGRKRKFDIDFVEDYSLELPNHGSKFTRRLYSAIGTSSAVGAGLGRVSDTLVDRFKFFPSVEMLGIKRIPGMNTTMIKWSWSWIFPNSERNQSGVNLPSIGKLVSAVDRQVIVTCYACFEFLVHIPDTNEASNPDACVVGKSFQTQTMGSEISWTMLKSGTNVDMKSSSENATEPKPNPTFQTVDYRSTIDIGWIPDHGVDFFILFFLDLHEKWRIIFEKAELHLATSRKILLLNKGRTEGFIDNLLIDAQQWSNFRALLQIHVRTARDLLQDYREKRFLCEEVRECELLKIQRGESIPEKNQYSALKSSGIARTSTASNPPRTNDEEKVYALDELSKIIDTMESEVTDEISKLDKNTSDLIELEFNLVSIYEARTSKLTGTSMKRLSWITFIFLPLMFVASLFGMNVDILENNPHWWWAFVFGGSFFALSIVFWASLKFFPINQWLETSSDVAPSRGLWPLTRKMKISLRKRLKESELVDLELGRPLKPKGTVFSFEPPPRQWTTKLKKY